MRIILKIFFLILLSCSCKDIHRKEYSNTTSTIIAKTGFKYVYISFDENGKGLAKKGVIKNKNDIYSQKNATDSILFLINSPKEYFERLEKVEKNKQIGTKMSEVWHIEVFNNKDKVLDSDKTDSEFWSLIKIIADDIPKGYNPFVEGGFEL